MGDSGPLLLGEEIKKKKNQIFTWHSLPTLFTSGPYRILYFRKKGNYQEAKKTYQDILEGLKIFYQEVIKGSF